MSGAPTNRYATLAARVYHLDKAIGRSFGDLEFYAERLAGETGPILEPAVGNGRALIPLLEAGLAVSGFDASPEMLDICRAECAARGLDPALELAFFQDFEVSEPQAAIIIPAGSIQLVVDPEETAAVLRRFFGALRPGGRLILDLDSLAALADTAPSARRWIDPGDASGAGSGDALTLLGVHEGTDFAAQTHTTQLRYERWRDGALVESELDLFTLRLWGHFEMVTLLRSIGFAEVTVSADYRHGVAPDADTSVVTIETVRPR